MNVEIYHICETLDSLTSKEEQQKIIDILDQNKSVILDMSNCTYVSSMGLRVILSVYKIAISSGLSLFLVGVRKDVKDVMIATGFVQFFKYFDTVEECLNQVG